MLFVLYMGFVRVSGAGVADSREQASEEPTGRAAASGAAAGPVH